MYNICAEDILTIIIFSLSVLIHQPRLIGQSCQNSEIRLISEIPATCGNLTMTMIHDQDDRPFLYVANKEAGLRIYDVSDIENPSEAAQIPASDLGNLQVMSLNQSGHLLGLALGSFFLSGENSGIALIDISSPENPVVLDYWVNNDPSEGAGGVYLQDEFAYLAAMGHGLMIFDISDPSDMQHLNTFVPDVDFPKENADLTKINARGLFVRNNLVYLTYDAGGIRIIDVTDKQNPLEIGKYSNPALLNYPRAYNNLVLDGNLLYTAIDYCGMEILDVSDPENMIPVSWWNQWNCPETNWFVSPGHTNEIAIDRENKTIFMSTGKSDLYAVDVFDPANPDSCNIFGGVENGIGTWGVSRYKNQLYLSYICTVGIPFPSNWSGIKILNYDVSTSLENQLFENVRIYPNPASETIWLESQNEVDLDKSRIFNADGQIVNYHTFPDPDHRKINITLLPSGIYFLQLESNNHIWTIRFIKI